jgi:hypothetical protein
MPHTQGPWETGSRMTRVEVLPKGWRMPMCIADCDCLIGPTSEAEKVANARLIASAPELLMACKCALADLEGILPPLGDENDYPAAWATMRELKAVIARAEGA